MNGNASDSNYQEFSESDLQIARVYPIRDLYEELGLGERDKNGGRIYTTREARTLVRHFEERRRNRAARLAAGLDLEKWKNTAPPEPEGMEGDRQ